MNRAKVKERIQERLVELGISQSNFGFKTIPSATELTVIVAGKPHTFRVPSGGMPESVDRELAKLEVIYRDHLNGQRDIEDCIAEQLCDCAESVA